VISIEKLYTLPLKTRLRKIVLLLQAEELELEVGREPHREYLRALSKMLVQDEKCGREMCSAAEACEKHLAKNETEVAKLRREINRLRHALLRYLGAEPAEWDLLKPASQDLDPTARTILPSEVYLEEIRSPFNVGSIFRSCEAFGVSRILLSPSTASPLHPRALKSGRGATHIVSWRFAELAEIEHQEGVFALELGGTPLEEFRFPERGVMLVGSEELGLSPEALNLAGRQAGRISIPMAGAKRSLNVAVAVGIVLQAWYGQLRVGKADRPPR
jgi:TrmH family RNA methyltransferase